MAMHNVLVTINKVYKQKKKKKEKKNMRMNDECNN